MSYPKDLDEYSEEELAAEITRREVLRRQGRCDYCGRDAALYPCKEVDRHIAIRNAQAAKARLGGDGR